MKKIVYLSAIYVAAALGLAGCDSNTATTNKAAANATSNTAVVVNSNAGAAMNSNMSSNMSANTSKTAIGSGDRSFAEKAAQGGMAEVQMGGLATEKAKNSEVTTFGQKMITDHSKANRELKEIADRKGISLPGGANEEQMKGLANLQKLSGAAFDKEYVKMMVEDHEKDVAEFQKQASSGTDAEIKRFAAETLPTLKMHLEMIKAIQGKMK